MQITGQTVQAIQVLLDGLLALQTTLLQIPVVSHDESLHIRSLPQTPVDQRYQQGSEQSGSPD